MARKEKYVHNGIALKRKVVSIKKLHRCNSCYFYDKDCYERDLYGNLKYNCTSDSLKTDYIYVPK